MLPSDVSAGFRSGNAGAETPQLPGAGFVFGAGTRKSGSNDATMARMTAYRTNRRAADAGGGRQPSSQHGMDVVTARPHTRLWKVTSKADIYESPPSGYLA